MVAIASQKPRRASANAALTAGASPTTTVRASGNAATASSNPSSLLIRQPLVLGTTRHVALGGRVYGLLPVQIPEPS
jgi:hypothetical protein